MQNSLANTGFVRGELDKFKSRYCCDELLLRY